MRATSAGWLGTDGASRQAPGQERHRLPAPARGELFIGNPSNVFHVMPLPAVLLRDELDAREIGRARYLKAPEKAHRERDFALGGAAIHVAESAFRSTKPPTRHAPLMPRPRPTKAAKIIGRRVAASSRAARPPGQAGRTQELRQSLIFGHRC